MKRQIAAIEFGTSKIVTMIAQNSGLDRLDIIGSGTVPYDGYSEGDWNTPRQMVQRVRDSVAAAELEAGTKVSELYVGIPGEFIHVRVSEAEVDAPEGVIDDTVVNAVQDLAADNLRLAEGGCMVLHRSRHGIPWMTARKPCRPAEEDRDCAPEWPSLSLSRCSSRTSAR